MNQLIMVFLISLLILVHEIGHFLAARAFGVRVTRFGIGMPIGPSWKLFTWGKTTFYIHAFLFGGYVSFAEPDPSDNEPTTVERESRGQRCAQHVGGSEELAPSAKSVPHLSRVSLVRLDLTNEGEGMLCGIKDKSGEILAFM